MWYLMVQSQHMTILASWYCLVFGGSGSAKGLYACIYLKKWRFGRVLPMPHTQTTEHRATQLVYSINFKLSHAISVKNIIAVVVKPRKCHSHRK